MLLTAIILFAFAAVLGLSVLVPVLKNNSTSKPMAILHGALAAVGLVLVLIVVLNASGPAPTGSLIFFAVAALGGFVMFGMDIKKKRIPKVLALGHPLLAAVGLIQLILFVIG